jgi:lipoate-protein ligase A
VRLPWEIRDTLGDTGRFHSADPAPVRSATFHRVDRPTLALGSAQPTERVNHRIADALGVEVVRRRSGGGGVLLVPDEFVWLDVVIPAGDPLWSADVGKAMVWVGECWAAALASLEVAGAVHRGGLVPSEWSRDVCFAGVGTGEVMAGHERGGTAKLVGISQRRTRGWARFQTMAHLRWRSELAAALVAPPAPTAAALASLVAVVSRSAEDVRSALVEALSTTD